MADEKNPLTSTASNDAFVFVPTIATVVIMLAILYGMATLTAQLVNWAVTPLDGVLWWVVVLVFTLLYVGAAVALIYQDNGIEVPLPSY